MSTDANPTRQGDLTSFDVAQGAGSGAPTCTSCSRQLTDIYHEVNGAVVCSSCRAKVEVELNSGSGTGRFARAFGFGLVGAAIGSAMWFAVLALFDMELGLLAIVVGFLVGKAVHMGSRGRGGWKYQTLAIALTYSAIVVTYIPFILKGWDDGGAGAAAAADSLLTAGAADAAPPAGDSTTAGEVAGVDGTADPAVSNLGIPGVLLGLVVLFAIAAASPILAGVENLIGLLIIGFALYQAWSMNRRVPISLSGPYRVGVPRDAAGPSPA